MAIIDMGRPRGLGGLTQPGAGCRRGFRRWARAGAGGWPRNGPRTPPWRAVSDLERGINATARKDTAGLPADALNLAGPVRALFVAAARGRAPAAGVVTAVQPHKQPASWAVDGGVHGFPAALTSFIGRGTETHQGAGLLEEHRLVTSAVYALYQQQADRGMATTPTATPL